MPLYLSDLPTEIILEISQHLGDAGMNALLRTNRRMEVLKKYLYRHDVTKSQSRSLIWAVQHGVETTFRQAISAGQHFKLLHPSHPIPPSFHIALQEATDRGYEYFVEMLLKLDGINPNCGNHTNRGLLALAIRRGHSAVAELLLTVTNLDPNARDLESDTTPLIQACQMGRVSIVRQLLARNDVDLNAFGFGRSTTPLIEACTRGDTEIVDLLLLAKGGIDVNLCDIHRNTPLIAACQGGHTEVINLLLAKDGIDVNFNNTLRDTPLMIAVRVKLAEVAKALLARDDLDPNIVNVADTYGNHVLWYSVHLGHDIIKSLLDHPNVDPNVVSSGGRTALIEACSAAVAERMRGRIGIERMRHMTGSRSRRLPVAGQSASEVIKVLLDRDGINPNIPDDTGRTPLFWASCGSLEAVNLLLGKEGIDPNARNKHGLTPLANACKGHLNTEATSIVRSLLSHCNTDPNIFDNKGVTALIKAMNNKRTAFGNREKIVSLLLDAGAR
ncbi:Ankyrin repeat-containing domain protein [Elaphomyces granulatus]